jgi:3-phosphoglycerate kinase
MPLQGRYTKTLDLIVGGGIEDGWMGLDAGPKTCALFRQGLSDATKIIYEMDLPVSSR